MENFIELEGEKGKEVFEILLRFRFKGTDYIALSPENDEDDSAAIFEIHKLDGGEEEYLTITDSNLAKEVFVNFVSIWEMSDEEDDEDDE